MYSKKNVLAGASSIENLVNPCKAPFDPVPSTVPDISYESHPNAPMCSFPGYLDPFLIITLFCILLFGIQLTLNLPFGSGLKVT